MDSTEEEEEGEEEASHHAIEIEGYFKEVSPKTEETHEVPSAQQF